MSRVVLVVDDEPGIVAVLSRLLADEGWTVYTAHDGAEALLAVGRVQPDIVLLDYMMPVMDGATFTQTLRRDPNARGLPVVIMSGLSESMIARKVKGYAAFVHKPFVFHALGKVLERAVGAARAPRRRR